MNLYQTQPVRDKHGISWHEEYLLGVIAAIQNGFITYIMEIATEVMAEATAHKSLTKLVEREYLNQERSKTDRRYVSITLTDKGRTFLKELQNG